jgi:hypothetical protein
VSDVVCQNQPAVAADTGDAQVLHGSVDTREMKPVLDDCWQLARRAAHNVAHNREDRGDTAKDILYIGT